MDIKAIISAGTQKSVAAGGPGISPGLDRTDRERI